MKAAITKAAVVAASVLFYSGAHAWDAPAAAQSRGRAGADSAAGQSQTKAIFEERCASCHGLDGRGRTSMGEMLEAPDFTDAEWQRGVTDERMRASVGDGKGQMPAFAGKLSPREINALVAYVRAFAEGGRQATAARGPRTCPCPSDYCSHDRPRAASVSGSGVARPSFLMTTAKPPA